VRCAASAGTRLVATILQQPIELRRGRAPWRRRRGRHRIPCKREVPPGRIRCCAVEYRIEFYEDESGRKPALDWIRDDLDVRERRALGTAMREILQRQGIGVCGTPFGRQLGGGLFEFRLRESELLLRVFCHAYGERIVLLVHGYDKGDDPSAKRQTREIAEARRRLVRWRQQYHDD